MLQITAYNSLVHSYGCYCTASGLLKLKRKNIPAVYLPFWTTLRNRHLKQSLSQYHDSLTCLTLVHMAMRLRIFIEMEDSPHMELLCTLSNLFDHIKWRLRGIF